MIKNRFREIATSLARNQKEFNDKIESVQGKITEHNNLRKKIILDIKTENHWPKREDRWLSKSSNQLSTYNGNLSTITAEDINVNIKTLPEVQLQYEKLTSVRCNLKYNLEIN